VFHNTYAWQPLLLRKRTEIRGDRSPINDGAGDRFRDFFETSMPDTLNLLLIRGIDGLSIDSHSYVALQKAHPTTVLVFCLQPRLVLNRASPTLSSLFRPAAYNHMM
jgi:hypothetical protein